jgi:hypothetical protein
MLIMSYFVTAVPGLCLGGSFDHWMRRIGLLAEICSSRFVASEDIKGTTIF